jgi:hypothetical protein
VAADGLEQFLMDYRQLPLADTVRLRRSAGPGRSHAIDVALAALAGRGRAPAGPAQTAPPPPEPFSPTTAALSAPVLPKRTRVRLDLNGEERVVVAKIAPARIRDAVRPGPSELPAAVAPSLPPDVETALAARGRRPPGPASPASGAGKLIAAPPR